MNIDKLKQIQEYKYGFVSSIDQEVFPKGLSEDIIKKISSKKKEPTWLLDFRVKAFKYWQKLKPPTWAELKIPEIDFQQISYLAVPKKNPFTGTEKPHNLEDIDPEIIKTFNRLGIGLVEQKRLAGIAVDAIIDSVSVKTTFQKELNRAGVIFCSFSEAVQKHPDLVQKYLGSVVPFSDNYYACLNSAVFSDGSFVYIPKGVKCPMELSSYFRINASGTGQFERTLIIAEDNSYGSYLEGCTAPQRDENQLHAAVVEIVCQQESEIRYSTVQNWYPGDNKGRGGVFNFVTKRGICKGKNSKISWTQVETGSAITWKYPSVILKGDSSLGEFFSLSYTGNYQQADTGTKMIHIGSNTKSKIISKSISSGHSSNTYRGLVRIARSAKDSRNYSQCDSLLLSPTSSCHTFPTLDNKNLQSQIEHEAFTSSLSQEAKFFLESRGLDSRQATNLAVTGFSGEILQKLPMEFAVEAKNLIEMNVEGFIG